MKHLVIGLLVFGIGCGEAGLVPPDPDPSDAADTTTPPGDAPAPDVQTTDSNTVDPDAPDVSTDVTSTNTCEPGEGCFGEPCTGADDCLSGICSMHLGDKVCSKTCDASCPAGWSCTLVGAGGADGQYVCISNYPNLCLPCETAEGCSSESPTACVKYPDGLSFCGGACDLDTPCPSGYSCQQVENTAGVTGFQCVSTAGICLCSNLAIASGLASPCQSENDFGICEGVRGCTEDGLSACDAPEAMAEVCNGVDDNCNGLVDENTCDDGNGCTTDVCAGEQGCEHTPLTEGECLDGDACTVGDHCEAGVCVGLPVNCDDGNPCTVDTCDGLGGCTNTPTPAPCDDGDNCTVGDLCAEGVCAGTATLNCNDSNPCTDDACGVEACTHTPNTLACDDGNACTDAAACKEGACVGTNATECDDENGCTTDSCDPGTGCTTAPNTLPCDDGDSCTLGDTCEAGSCQAGANALPCVDGDPCTDDGCDKLLGCVFSNNTADCDDQNMCTTISTCVEGSCIGSGGLVCEDGNLCTVDTCLADEGCTHKETTGGACNDANLCTTIDVCSKGKCKGGAPLGCDDNNPCTDDSCDPSVGCEFTPNQFACSDDNLCTTVDTCAGGVCVGGAIDSCEDGQPCTLDTCVPATGCQHAPAAGECSDGNACTLGDSCAGGECSPGGVSLDCDDGDPCTDDSCEPVAGCVTTLNTAPCDDGDACSEGSSCEAGACVGGVPIDCDDGTFCNGLETCDPAKGCIPGAPIDLSDEVACTVGICDEAADTVVQIPDDGKCISESPCDVGTCDSVKGCVFFPQAPCCGNGVVEGDEVCDDGNQNDEGDACSNTCESNLALDINFTNCSKTGPTGPNQGDCNASYVNDPQLNGKVTVEKGIQLWTVPVTATYRITAAGAQGGKHHQGVGGPGAQLSGDFFLTEGTVLKILVGQMGKNGDQYDVGGGGGTFVVLSDNTPMVVAAGGGAMGNCSASKKGMSGLSDTGSGNGGVGINNGDWCGCGGSGSAGGGFYTDGEPTGSGSAFLNGGHGGTASRPGQCVDPGWGGFGGGGNGGNGGGGGGGYQGGDAGGDGAFQNSSGKGGRSYNSGKNPQGFSGNNEGQGWVTIQKIKL